MEIYDLGIIIRALLHRGRPRFILKRDYPDRIKLSFYSKTIFPEILTLARAGTNE
jgi:hypothetical protein